MTNIGEIGLIGDKPRAKFRIGEAFERNQVRGIADLAAEVSHIDRKRVVGYIADYHEVLHDGGSSSAP